MSLKAKCLEIKTRVNIGVGGKALFYDDCIINIYNLANICFLPFLIVKICS